MTEFVSLVAGEVATAARGSQDAIKYAGRPKRRLAGSPHRTRRERRAFALLAGALSLYAALGGCKVLELAGLVTGEQRVAAPVFSPAGGDYSADQSISISDATAGATIYYTTDGSEPSASSSKYGGPISVAGDGSNVTLRAFALKSGMSASPVASSSFLVRYAKGSAAQAGAPSFTPPAGSYNASQNVAITSATSGATIYYTTDGSTPSTSSAVYSSPIVVAGNGTSETIRAIAAAAGNASSAVVTATYSINYSQTANPSFGPSSTTSTVDLNSPGVSISSATAGAAIYYTITTGTIATPPATPPTPTTSSTPYTAPIPVSGDQTVAKISAIAVAGGFAASGVATVTYTINYAQAAAPSFTPSGGTYGADQSVTLSDTTAGAAIHYTTDGTVPSASSPTYSGAIGVGGDGTVETINAVAVATGMKASPVASATYSISYGSTTLQPTLNVPGGAYARDINGVAGNPGPIQLSDATAGAVIYFTLNGSTPTTSSPVYTPGTTPPIAVTGDGTTKTITVMAKAPGLKQSPITQGTYTIHYAVAQPALSTTATPVSGSASAGTYAADLTVSIADTTAGAVIHYTTDGSAPNSGSAVYSGPISIAGNGTVTTVNAIGIDPAGIRPASTVASASYTISYPQAALPSFSAAPGTYTANLTGASAVAINEATPGATIYYTSDGTLPTVPPTGSTQTYSGPISITGNGTSTSINAIASASGYTTSAIAHAGYSIQYPQDSLSPQITIAAPSDGSLASDGVHVAAPSAPSGVPAVTISGSGATFSTSFYYVVSYDNLSPSPPSSSNPATLTSNGPSFAFAMSGISDTSPHTVTIEAYAIDPNTTAGALTIVTFYVNQAAPAPTFAPAAGNYSIAQSVTLSTSTPGASIYYTTDGTTPTYPATGTTALYSGTAISVSTVGVAVPIIAIVSAPGYAASSEASGTYTVLTDPVLSVGGATSTTITSSWSSVAGAGAYLLQRDTSASFTNPATVYFGSALSATDSGLSSSTTYYYRVKAVYTAGFSAGATGSGPTLDASGMPAPTSSMPPLLSGATQPPPPGGSGDYWVPPTWGWKEGGYSYYVFDHDYYNASTAYLYAYDQNGNLVGQWSFGGRYVSSITISGTSIVIQFQSTTWTILWSTIQL